MRTYSIRILPLLCRFLCILLNFVSVEEAWAARDNAILGGFPLAGDFRFAMVDQTPFDRPPEDSPLWQEGSFGPPGMTVKVQQREGIAWVVYRFTLAPKQYATLSDPALYLPVPPDGEKYYLNGDFIGEAGNISPRYRAVPSGPRYVRFSQSSLQTGTNELAMKALFIGPNRYDFTDPIYMGDHYDMYAAFEKQQGHIITAEAMFLTYYLTTIIIFLFVFFKDTKQALYLAFLIFMLFRTISFTIYSHLAFEFNFYNEYFFNIQRAMYPLLSASIMFLVILFSGKKLDKLFWLIVAMCGTMAMLELTLRPIQALTVLILPYKILMFFVSCYCLYVSSKNLWVKKEESLPMMIGVLSYFLGMQLDLYAGTQISDYATSFFILCMLYALTSRHVRLEKRLVTVSNKLLDAHEQERRRLARDIHDGIGQSLIGLKIKLQLLGQRREANSCEEAGIFESLVKNTDNIIEEVRRTAKDLRPSFVENTRLFDAMRWYAENFLKNYPITLHFFPGIEEFRDPPIRVKDNLFRIFQEILSNAVKHSHATRIDVTLFKAGNNLILVVNDNGRGFVAATGEPPGIGIITMAERAELLGGTCNVKSKEGEGTTIQVEVPLP